MRVVVTRARESADELAARLRGEGFEVVECPLIRIEPLDAPSVDPSGYEWVVVTSRIAVGELFRRLHGSLPRVAAIGPGTAAALREHGVEPALVPARSTQEGLLAELPCPPGRVLFVAAEGARDVLPRALGADVVHLYRTVEAPPRRFPDAGLVVLASASAARALASVRVDLPCVSIGPVTSEEARRRGLEVVAEASSHDLDGLLEAVKLAACREGSHTGSSPS